MEQYFPQIASCVLWGQASFWIEAHCMGKAGGDMLLGRRHTLREESGKRHLLREDVCFLRGGMFSGRTCALREETLR